MAASFDGKLVIVEGSSSCSNGKEEESKQSDQQKQPQSTKESKPPLTDDQKLKQLNKDDMILNEKGEVVEAPRSNKKCPCGSKKVYKKCVCLIKDIERKTEFINRMTKKFEQEKPKQNGMLLL